MIKVYSIRKVTIINICVRNNRSLLIPYTKTNSKWIKSYMEELIL